MTHRAVLKNLRKYGENGSNILQGRRLLYNENISARISSFKESFYERRAQRPNFFTLFAADGERKGWGGQAILLTPPPSRVADGERKGWGGVTPWRWNVWGVGVKRGGGVTRQTRSWGGAWGMFIIDTTTQSYAKKKNCLRHTKTSKTDLLRKIINLLAPQATTKENPNIVLNYVYKKPAKMQIGVPRDRDFVQELP